MMKTKDKLAAMENMLERIIGDNQLATTSIGDYIQRVELALRLQDNINNRGTNTNCVKHMGRLFLV